MAFTKHATFEQAQVLGVKGSPTRIRAASFDRLSDYKDFRTGDGYLYVRLRAISSRVNRNHDGWPSVELAGGKDIFERHAKESSTGFTVEAKDGNQKFGFATFMGKPNFIDHNNSDPKRARGVVVDAKLRVLGADHESAKGDRYWTSGEADPEHLPPTEIELLIEVDAKRFPKYAKHLKDGDLDGFSMGCDVEYSKCSHCGHIATNPNEYCSHIMMKGAQHDFKTADGKRVPRRSYENCYNIGFFEISSVFEPADETALGREVIAAIRNEGWVQQPGDDFGEYQDPIPGRGYENERYVVDRAHEIAEKAGVPWNEAIEMAQREQQGQPKGIHGEGTEEHEYPKRWQYQQQGINDEGLPIGSPPVEYGGIPAGATNPEFYDAAQDLLNQKYPKRPVMNDPYMSSVKIAENPLPQSMHTTAPEDVDTLRQEEICPVCGENMDSEKCDVCGFVEPPKGFDNPDLNKAQEIKQKMRQDDEALVQSPEGSPENVGNQGMPQGPDTQMPDQTHEQGGGGGSFMQTRNRVPTASVMSEMRWAPAIDSKLAGRINQFEQPIQATKKPATNQPANPAVVKNPTKPVTAAMRTAQELIQAANKGDTMSTRTADGPTGPDAAPDTRTDVTGVGGVIEPSNEQASKADAQVDVTSIGTTGVTDVSADSTESLPTASQESDDSGFNKDKTTDDSGPTKTFGDSDGSEKGFTDEVTTESLEGNWNKGSSVHQGYDAAPFYDQPGLSGGSANKGTEPVDSVGKAMERVDVLQAATTPENNSGPTSTWTGTDGNKIYKQQDPVTNESMALGGGGVGTESPNWTSHVVAAIKLTDLELELDLLPRDEKYNRIAELQAQTPDEVRSQLNAFSRVKTAGIAKLAAKRTSGVTSLPAAFGRRTAAPAPDWRTPGRSFDRVTDAEHLASTEEQVTEDVYDSGLFS